jgi:hypothetical protein
MARTLSLLALVATLAFPATLSAASSTDGTLSVRRGHGLIVLKVRGTIIGSLASGMVRIKDLTPFDGQAPRFRHCRTLRPISPSTTVCKGRKISFRALSGPYVVTTRGTGTFLSAVGHGSVMFDGADLAPTGVMSFDGGPYQPIPIDPTTYQLGTSTSGR